MKKFFIKILVAATAAAEVFVCASCVGGSAASGNVAIIPVPDSVVANSGTFVLSEGTTVGATVDNLKPAAEYLAALLSPATGFDVKAVEGEGTITLAIGNVEGAQGGYELEVTGSKVTITGNSYGGVIAGIQSLRQMLPAQIESKVKVDTVKWEVPAVKITDAPEFQWRGIMLDVSRHFYTVDEVKELLDVMALYKMNRFHWHLTDDQGWRVEIKKYPKLTENGAWRKFNSHDRECIRLSKAEENSDYAIPEDKIRVVEGDTLYGGFYTQEQIRDVVAYAKVRGIEIVPEIDMPGHMLAAVSNYDGVSCFAETGWGQTFSSPVCPGKDSAMEFCKNVYNELIDLFPYEYVHIGGDEVEKANWKKCPDCQKRMADNNLKTEEELQSWFIHQMEKFINSKVKKMIGWDEIIEGGLSKTATVMWWRNWMSDSPAKAAGQGNYIINTPNGDFYLDYKEDKNSIPNIIKYDMTDGLPADQQKLVMGVQGNIWCEWIPSAARMQYQAVPRLLAIAELGWSKPGKRDIDDFMTRLAAQFERLNIMGINYRIPDLEGFHATNAFVGEGVLKATCLDPTAQIRYTTDGSLPTMDSPLFKDSLKVKETTDFIFATFRPNGKRCDITRARFVKSEYAQAVSGSPVDKGLVTKWYEFKGNKCADIDKAPLNETFTTVSVEIPEGAKGNIGLVTEGYITVPADDIYTFALLSDDGSTLIIDGDMVVDNDGPHSPREIIGQKALAKGIHKISVRYFDQNGGQLRLVVTDSKGNTLEPAAVYKH